MLSYTSTPLQVLKHKGREIQSFLPAQNGNIDPTTVSSFGNEWTEYSSFLEEEIAIPGRQYFDIVSEQMLNKDSYVLDVGCGMGRWSYFVADRAKFIEAIDPSEAVYSAKDFTSAKDNIRITQADVDNIPFADDSFDFVFSLGVLHHIPNTEKAIKDVVKKVKPGGYFLIYLYYSLDNRGPFFKLLFHASNLIRQVVSRLPNFLKNSVCNLLAVLLYLPCIKASQIVRKTFPNMNWYKKIPLSYYADKSFKIIKNDSLDRFGTPLEQRFSRQEIGEMLQKAGLSSIVFSENEPYWHAVGKKI